MTPHLSAHAVPPTLTTAGLSRAGQGQRGRTAEGARVVSWELRGTKARSGEGGRGTRAPRAAV